ncbi:MAG: septum formation inhibitor Maf [Desulfobacca sp.]|nr:septum formation inhibitor Maf [Desulfobacca sp.]
MATRIPFFLILASGSPRRKALLADLGIQLKIVSTEIPEWPEQNEIPLSFSRRMARRKTELVSAVYPNHWVLGADTVVVLEKRIFGKPENSREAKKFLQALSGKTHQVITSFCLKNQVLKRSTTRSVSSRVTFKTLSPQEIDWYIRTGEPLDKAGAYAIQGKGAFCVQKMRGSYTNVVGLPISEVLETLEKYTGFQLG